MKSKSTYTGSSLSKGCDVPKVANHIAVNSHTIALLETSPQGRFQEPVKGYAVRMIVTMRDRSFIHLNWKTADDARNWANSIEALKNRNMIFWYDC